MAQQQTSDALAPTESLEAGMRPKRNLWENILNFAQRKPLGAFGAVVVILLVIVAILAPLVSCIQSSRHYQKDGKRHSA